MSHLFDDQVYFSILITITAVPGKKLFFFAKSKPLKSDLST